ncbi:MAG: HI0074 family nucleotidyltransferase substrate-binding subunit [bacterium]|nr:HI0074 family nucleotidyltransferase substrate-binding subunit [bacterium]
MKYDTRFKELQSAFDRLREAMPIVKTRLEKDGAIKRFEFVFELVWKTLKDFAEEKGRLDVASPKDAFRVAADLGLLDDPTLWFHFLKSRNEAVHLYNEESADEVFSHIPQFIKAVETLMDHMNSQL